MSGRASSKCYIHGQTRWHSLALTAILPVAVALPASALFAQTRGQMLDTITVTGRNLPEASPDIEVKSKTGSRLDLQVRETPASIEVISQEAMQQRGARTLEEAMRGAVGVSAGGNPGRKVCR